MPGARGHYSARRRWRSTMVEDKCRFILPKQIFSSHISNQFVTPSHNPKVFFFVYSYSHLAYLLVDYVLRKGTAILEWFAQPMLQAPLTFRLFFRASFDNLLSKIENHPIFTNTSPCHPRHSQKPCQKPLSLGWGIFPEQEIKK